MIKTQGHQEQQQSGYTSQASTASRRPAPRLVKVIPISQEDLEEYMRWRAQRGRRFR